MTMIDRLIMLFRSKRLTGKLSKKELQKEALYLDPKKRKTYIPRDLRVYKEITDDAAAILSTSKQDLNLCGLEKLTSNSAASLGMFRGGNLYLALREMSETVADGLSKFRGGNKTLIGFYGNFKLTAEAAAHLANIETTLDLTGLEHLSDAAAASLSKYRGQNLILSGLVRITDAVANSLSKVQAHLVLGLTEISDAAAESLSQHQGGLSLRGLTELSDNAAESLSKYQGCFGLRLSDSAAEQLGPGAWSDHNPSGKTPSVEDQVRELINSAIAYKTIDEYEKAFDDYDKAFELLPAAEQPIELQSSTRCLSVTFSVTFSPDGKTIASGGDDGKIKLWDSQSGKLIKTLIGHERDIHSVTFSPDGTTIASGGGDIRLWDSRSGAYIKTIIAPHRYRVSCIAFSPDGKTIASGGHDGKIKLWDSHSGDELRTVGLHHGPLCSVAFSPNGKIIAGGSYYRGYSGNHGINFWDKDSSCTRIQLPQYRGLSGTVNCVAFSPDGETFATAYDGVVSLWYSHCGETTCIYFDGDVCSIAFSPDGKTIASGGEDETISLWDSQSGYHIKTLYGHTDIVRSITFSPNGKTIVSASDDCTIKLWDVSVLTAP